MKYGRFTIIEEFSDFPYKNAKTKTRMVKVLCDCGNIVIREKRKVLSGYSNSCGCKKKEKISIASKKHGYRNDIAYPIYNAMMWRCENPKNPRYKDYGGRGIKVCQEWHDVETFIKWCHENGYKKGLQLDRIDNNGNYEPSNCRFLTPSQNARNRRNTVIKDNMPLKDWLDKVSKNTGINPSTVRSRYYALKRKGFEADDITIEMLINSRQSITNPKEKS